MGVGGGFPMERGSEKVLAILIGDTTKFSN